MIESALGQAMPSEQGKAPAERLPDVGRTQTLAKTLIDNDAKRAKADQRIRGMIDGNAPYSPAILRRHAQSDRCNINWMEGKAQHSTAMTPYTDLLRGSARMVTVRLNEPDLFLRNYWSEVVSEEFDRALKEWRGFLYNVDLIMWDRLQYGKGFAMWGNGRDPEFHWVNRFNVHVPDTTRANVDELDVLCIEEKIPVDKLWACRNKPGWNADAILDAVNRSQAETGSRFDESRPDLTQAKMNDKDVLDGISSNKVHVAHVFQKEMGGRISYYVVEVEQGGRYSGNVYSTAKYLYRGAGEVEEWCHRFWATFHENRDGSWNGASGLGKDIVAQIEVKNKLLCTTVDSAVTRSMLTLQATTAADWTSGPVAKVMGRIMVIPPGHTPVNTATYVGDVEGLLVTNREIEQTLTRNTGIYRPQPEKEQGNPPTATEAMIRAQQSTVLSNSAVIRFYSDIDQLYAEIYRRLTDDEPEGTRSKMKKEFRRRCEERGVNFKSMKDVDYVRAYRNIGNGSPAVRLQNIEAVGGRSQMWPESGQMAYERDRITAYLGAEVADAYFPKEQINLITRDHQIAGLENDSMVHGSPVEVGGEDNHVIHAQKHLEAAVAGLQSVEQGADPATVLAANESIMPHAHLHIQQLEANPGRKNEARALRQQWKQVAQANDQLRQSAERILEQRQKAMEAEQEAEAIRQRTDPKLLIEQARSEAELELARSRQGQAMEHHRAKHEQELAIADATAAAEIQREGAKAMAAIEKARASMEADLAKQLADAEAKVAEARRAAVAAVPKAPEIPAAKVEVQKDESGEPKRITFERGKDGKITSASVQIEQGSGRETSKTVEFNRGKDGKIKSAVVNDGGKKET